MERELTVGSVVGPYLLERELGVGGMGAVFFARHVETRRPVALKTSLGGARHRIALRAEIDALLSVDHPAVVRVIDHGRHELAPWFAMEFVEGTSLAESLSESLPTRRVQVTTLTGEPSELGSLPTRELSLRGPDRGDQLLSHLAHVCRGLAHVHAAGLIHRDLKPDNIIVRPSGEPVLVDFGIAERASGVVREWLTRPRSSIAGTPFYMAPEAFRGETLDSRSDLYSIGCMMFEVLAGHPPFQGASPAAIGTGHVHHRIPVLPPSVPAALRELIESLLAKSPAERPAFADDVARVIEAALGLEKNESGPAPMQFFRPTLVGRDAERSVWLGVLDELVDGTGGCLAVVGERGAGRTRVLSECLEDAMRADAEIYVVGSGRDSDAQTPFASLLSELVDRALERGVESALELFGEERAVLVRHLPTIATLGDVPVEPPPALPAPLEVARMTEAWVRLLTRFSPDARIVIAVDDAGERMIPHFLQAQRELAHTGAPILVVASMTPETASRLGDFPASRTIHMSELSVADGAELAASMLAIRRPPDALKRVVEGLPAIRAASVVDVVRRAIVTGLVRRTDEGWAVDAELDAWSAPGAGVESMQRLGSEQRALAARLALAGPRVPFELVESLGGRGSLETVSLLLERGHLVIEEGGVRFVNDAFRERLVDEMSPDEREEVHRRLADELDRRGRLAEAAEHYRRAGDLDAARSAFARAALREHEAYRVAEAAEHFDAYLALEPPPSAELVTAYRTMFMSLVRGGRYARASELVGEALDVARSHGTFDDVASIAISAAVGCRVTGQADRAAELRDIAMSRMDEVSDRTAAMIHVHRGHESLDVRRWEDAEQAFDAAVACAEGNPELVPEKLVAMLNRAGALICSLRYDEALRLYDELERQAPAVGRHDLLAYARLNRGIVRGDTSPDAAGALALVEDAMTLFRRFVDRWGEVHAHDARARILNLAGRHREALATVTLARAMREEMGLPPSISVTYENVRARYALGEVDEALQTARNALVDAGPEVPSIYLAAFGARASRRAGDLESAEWFLRTGEEICRVDAAPPHRVLLEIERVHLRLARGDEPEVDFDLRCPVARELEVGRAVEQLRDALDAHREGRSLVSGEVSERQE